MSVVGVVVSLVIGGVSQKQRAGIKVKDWQPPAELGSHECCATGSSC